MSSLDLAFCFERNLAMPCMQNANAGPSQPESECMTQRRLWAGSVAATRRQAYAGYRLPCFRFRIAWTDGEAMPNCRAMARRPLPCFFKVKTSPARLSSVTGRPSFTLALVWGPGRVSYRFSVLPFRCSRNASGNL